MEHFQDLGEKKKSHRAFHNDVMSQMQIVEPKQSIKVHSIKCNNSSKTSETKFDKTLKTYILYTLKKCTKNALIYLSVNQSLK